MGQVMGIGIDLVEIDRVKKAYRKDSFRCKYYSKAEQQLIERKAARAASAFAGKEAVVKAIGTGFHGIAPAEIEILRDDLGAPYVRLSGQAESVAGQRGIRRMLISLSDTEQMAIAYVIAEGDEV